MDASLLDREVEFSLEPILVFNSFRNHVQEFLTNPYIRLQELDELLAFVRIHPNTLLQPLKPEPGYHTAHSIARSSLPLMDIKDDDPPFAIPLLVFWLDLTQSVMR